VRSRCSCIAVVCGVLGSQPSGPKETEPLGKGATLVHYGVNAAYPENAKTIGPALCQFQGCPPRLRTTCTASANHLFASLFFLLLLLFFRVNLTSDLLESIQHSFVTGVPINDHRRYLVLAANARSNVARAPFASVAREVPAIEMQFELEFVVCVAGAWATLDTPRSK